MSMLRMTTYLILVICEMTHLYIKIKFQGITFNSFASTLSSHLLSVSHFMSFLPAPALYLINFHSEKLFLFFNLKNIYSNNTAEFFVLCLFYTKLAETVSKLLMNNLIFLSTVIKVRFLLMLLLYMWLNHTCYLLVMRKEQVEISDFQKKKKNTLEL